MKRNCFVTVAVIGVVLLSLNGSQGAQVQPFDLRKCQQELEIMKGILRTTLGFASQELAAGLKSDKVETKDQCKAVLRLAVVATSTSERFISPGRVPFLPFPRPAFET